MRWMWTSRLYRSEDVSQRERDARLSASWRNDQKSVKWHRADGLLLHHWIKILSDSWKSSAEVQYVFILMLSVVRWDTPVSTRLVSSPLLLLSCPCPVSSWCNQESRGSSMMLGEQGGGGDVCWGGQSDIISGVMSANRSNLSKSKDMLLKYYFG